MARPHEVIPERYDDVSKKREYIHDLFNRGARHYDRIGAIGSFGTGHYYRRRALQLGGVRPGMGVIDVACGTGAVTRAILELLAGGGRVRGVDPSEGMLAEARRSFPGVDFQTGRAEALPADDGEFDFLTMGYALRHVEDLGVAFREYRRVLKPGGRVLLLEISRPRTRAGHALAKLYFGRLLPLVCKLSTGSDDAREMMAYYWETIDACVPPETILDALRGAGFADVKRRVEMGIFSDYSARVPDR
jgi:demethylmenaquinone methyltransferase/2-methoxy-6-polyprenyl-1,4-benzoquinol methylase